MSIKVSVMQNLVLAFEYHLPTRFSGKSCGGIHRLHPHHFQGLLYLRCIFEIVNARWEEKSIPDCGTFSGPIEKGRQPQPFSRNLRMRVSPASLGYPEVGFEMPVSSKLDGRADALLLWRKACVAEVHEVACCEVPEGSKDNRDPEKSIITHAEAKPVQIRNNERVRPGMIVPPAQVHLYSIAILEGEHLLRVNNVRNPSNVCMLGPHRPTKRARM